MRYINETEIEAYCQKLRGEERSPVTVAKYCREVGAFCAWLSGREVTKAEAVAYKAHLVAHHAPSGVNVAIAALNGFFAFMEWHDMRLKSIKVQRRLFAAAEKELSKGEYERLLTVAAQKRNKRLYFLMQTVCATGIRVSELQFITVQAVEAGVAYIQGKGGKHRQVLLPHALCKMLKGYCKAQHIRAGAVFVSRNGKPLDRSNIWSDMKKLCKAAGVAEGKVFPHNLRHLFARTYYSRQKDVVRLADILGHASVNTTRIYTMESGETHRRQIQKLGLLRC